MTTPGSSWSAQQLVEFLAALAPSGDEQALVTTAVERAAEALEAEIGAFVQRESVLASVGFVAGKVPERELVKLSRSRRVTGELPRLGAVAAASAPLDSTPATTLTVVRVGSLEFETTEIGILTGMARVLDLTLETLRTLERERSLRIESERNARERSELLKTLQKRQLLLEKSAVIQRAISRRAPLQSVLDAIVEAAVELLGDEVAALRLVDPEDETAMIAAATRGVPPGLGSQIERGQVGEGVGGRAITEDRLVVIEDYERASGTIASFAADRLQAAMAAPVHERDAVIGSLTVASYEPGRSYSADDQAMLLAFAEHASLALMDAKTVDAMVHQALHDSLTSLPNRTLFLDRLEHSLARAKREGGTVALLFLDLDRFKTVNDRLGHEAGDALLVGVAERLREQVRVADTAARLGGDEFAILMEQVHDRSDAARLAERITEAMNAPFALNGEDVYVSASIGIAYGGADDQDVLRNADLAMYRAKNEGRGRFEFYEPEMRAAVLERLALEADLRQAVERDEFVLHYQPIVDLASTRPRALEALVRWNHPVRGLIAPLEFIPLAEETGAIISIGRWVLRQACHRAAAWQGANGSEPRVAVSVNLSGKQLQQAGLAEEVAEALERSGLDPGYLVLEITETVLLEDIDSTAATLRRLNELGVHIAVDDFGTGYTALRYLNSFPLDILKLAKPFVDGLGLSEADSTLAQAVLSLGHTLGLQVVAEGIERPEQLARLRDMGCGLGQGYLFGRPASGSAVDLMLRRAGPQKLAAAASEPDTASALP